MSYCYCMPRRNMVRIAPGTTPREAGVSYVSSLAVMGTRGEWVWARGRANALKGWETRRRLQAEAHARLMASAPQVVPTPAEHCEEHAEEEKEEVVTLVIETPTTTETKPAPVPVALTLVR